MHPRKSTSAAHGSKGMLAQVCGWQSSRGHPPKAWRMGLYLRVPAPLHNIGKKFRTQD